MSTKEPSEEQSFEHAKIPYVIKDYISPNGSHNTIRMDSIDDPRAYGASSELQQQLYTILNILMDDKEAAHDINSMKERGFFFVLDDYFHGVDNEVHEILPVMSIANEARARNLVQDEHGHETAAKHIHLARHETRHGNQPNEYNAFKILKLTPLDAIKNVIVSEADAQAEAVLHAVDYYNRTDSPAIIQSMLSENYVFQNTMQQAVEYDGSAWFHLSDEVYDANIRAAAFLGWMDSAGNSDHQQAIKSYVKHVAVKYEAALNLSEANEKEVSNMLNAYSSLDDKSKAELAQKLRDFNNDFKKNWGVEYLNSPLGSDAKAFDLNDLRRYADRQFSENYVDRTMGRHSEAYNSLLSGDANQLGALLNTNIDQDQLNDLSGLRDRVALLHHENQQRFEAILGAHPDVDAEHVIGSSAPNLSVVSPK